MELLGTEQPRWERRGQWELPGRPERRDHTDHPASREPERCTEAWGRTQAWDRREA